MNATRTPNGAAGEDTRFEIEESVNSHIERMFTQAAKSRALEHSVGYNSDLGANLPDHRRLQALQAECDAAVSFHAGRALDIALQLVFAVVADRIFGRKSKGVANKTVLLDRKEHDLHHLYTRILEEASGPDGVGGDMLVKTLDHAYKTALHKGVVDIMEGDNNIIGSYVTAENQPFRPINRIGWSVGAELTMDDSDGKPWLEKLLRPVTPHGFDEMPLKTFEDFLEKADRSYFGEAHLKEDRSGGLNMRSNDYRARDNIAFKPFARAGTEFFGRLCREIVDMAHQSRIWHKRLADREWERSYHNSLRMIASLFRNTLSAEDADRLNAEVEKARRLKPSGNEPILPDQGDFFYEGLHKKLVLQ